MLKRNPAAAIKLDELFSRRAAQLEEYPHSGKLGRVVGTRELLARPNYILIYDVSQEAVRILRVLHAARQWPPAS